jgi:membrane-associated phospholipid phosphatase
VGPRFFLFGDTGPLSGVIAPWLESLMRTPTFMRDCFPSGHTSTTLLVLIYAFINARRFFWGMLPVALGLFLATLAGRFHYGVDLLCAVPLTLAVWNLTALATRLNPRGNDATRVGGLPARQPLRA